jgi:predicted Fe-S protein YdhL (DUF1289 family)
MDNIEPPIKVCESNFNHPLKKGDCSAKTDERFNWRSNNEHSKSVKLKRAQVISFSASDKPGKTINRTLGLCGLPSGVLRLKLSER